MFSSRCKDVNTQIIEEIINLRQDQADILGYPNHAAYIQVKSKLTFYVLPLFRCTNLLDIKIKLFKAFLHL